MIITALDNFCVSWNHVDFYISDDFFLGGSLCDFVWGAERSWLCVMLVKLGGNLQLQLCFPFYELGLLSDFCTPLGHILNSAIVSIIGIWDMTALLYTSFKYHSRDVLFTTCWAFIYFIDGFNYVFGGEIKVIKCGVDLTVFTDFWFLLLCWWWITKYAGVLLL